jgi:hypothetical protein
MIKNTLSTEFREVPCPVVELLLGSDVSSAGAAVEPVDELKKLVDDVTDGDENKLECWLFTSFFSSTA